MSDASLAPQPPRAFSRPDAPADGPRADGALTDGALTDGALTDAPDAGAGRAEASVRASVARAVQAIDGRDGLLAEADAARQALCNAVGVLAAWLRDDELPPERMLVLLKAAVRCGIEAYYGAA